MSKKIIMETLSNIKSNNNGIHPDIESRLSEGKHSLKDNPILPSGSEYGLFVELVNERFNDICNKVKRTYNTDKLDDKLILGGMMSNVYETMNLESKHRKKLEELAIRMVKEEFDLPDDIKFEACLTPNINIEGVKYHKDKLDEKMIFDNYEKIVEARGEIHKRRFLNAMSQGAAKKAHHMYHMVDDELTNLDPRLPNNYGKLMNDADYAYFKIPKMERQVKGGVVRVENGDNGYPKIKAEAMVFPVLVHELVKGVMEVLSSHGLPKEKKVCDYVLNNSDSIEDEHFDMILGPIIWGKFTNLFDGDDFKLKHYVYTDLVSLPTNEFNKIMREIVMGTKEAEKTIKRMCEEVKNDFIREEYEKSLSEVNIKDDDIGTFDLEDFEQFF